MAWDFETEPEFQEKLDWMDSFVREKVEPLSFLGIHPYDAKNSKRNELVRPLQEAVRQQDLWACHLGPKLGGKVIGSFVMGIADGPTEAHKVTVARQHLRAYKGIEDPNFPDCSIPNRTSAAIALYGDPAETLRELAFGGAD